MTMETICAIKAAHFSLHFRILRDLLECRQWWCLGTILKFFWRMSWWIAMAFLFSWPMDGSFSTDGFSCCCCSQMANAPPWFSYLFSQWLFSTDGSRWMVFLDSTDSNGNGFSQPMAFSTIGFLDSIDSLNRKKTKDGFSQRIFSRWMAYLYGWWFLILNGWLSRLDIWCFSTDGNGNSWPDGTIVLKGWMAFLDLKDSDGFSLWMVVDWFARWMVIDWWLLLKDRWLFWMEGSGEMAFLMALLFSWVCSSDVEHPRDHGFLIFFHGGFSQQMVLDRWLFLTRRIEMVFLNRLLSRHG